MDSTEIRTVAIPRAIREEGGSTLSSFAYPLHGTMHPYARQPSRLPTSKHRLLASDATPLQAHYKVTYCWRRTDTKTTSLLPSALSKRVHGAEHTIASHTLAERVSHLEYFSDHAILLPARMECTRHCTCWGYTQSLTFPRVYVVCEVVGGVAEEPRPRRWQSDIEH